MHFAVFTVAWLDKLGSHPYLGQVSLLLACVRAEFSQKFIKGGIRKLFNVFILSKDWPVSFTKLAQLDSLISHVIILILVHNFIHGI